MNNVNFCKRDIIITDLIEKNKGFLALYGMTYWCGGLIDCINKDVDYIIDKKAIVNNGKPVISLCGVPVIDIDYFAKKCEEKKRNTIIIMSVSENVRVDIHIEIAKYNLDVDVVDLFENMEYFNTRTFELCGRKYELYEHMFNCGYHDTRMTERSVELSLAIDYICHHKRVIEVGAVTPYYFKDENIAQIIDPTDIHGGLCKASVFDIDLSDRNVLSISTIEHIGTNDYGMHESYTVIDALEKIRTEAKSYLITAPLGYNPLLDEWVIQNKNCGDMYLMVRGFANDWKELDSYKYNGDIDYTPICANGLVIFSDDLFV